MTSLIEQAQATLVSVNVMKVALEKAAKDKTLPLKERLDHLIVLSQLGGAHSDWVFHGWDDLKINPLERQHTERYQTYDLLDLLYNAVDEASEELEAEYQRFMESFIITPDECFMDWLLWYKEEPDYIALVEAMCDSATLTFQYEW